MGALSQRSILVSLVRNGESHILILRFQKILTFWCPVKGLRWLPGYQYLYRKLAYHFTGSPRIDGRRGDYGWPLPSYEELRKNAKTLFRTDYTQLLGIDLNAEAQLQHLKELVPHTEPFPYTEQPQAGLRYHTKQPWYESGKARILQAMIRKYRPKRIIEVGSGFSSALMLDALNEDSETRLTFIDPYPERLLSLLTEADRRRCEVRPQKVQEIDPALFTELGAQDILFIDSSHVGKLGADVNYLFFEAIPRIGSGCFVHIHDIHWPFEFDQSWYERGIAWNEPYFVRAFLQFNREFSIFLWMSYLLNSHREKTIELFPQGVAEPGSAIWLQRN